LHLCRLGNVSVLKEAFQSGSRDHIADKELLKQALLEVAGLRESMGGLSKTHIQAAEEIEILKSRLYSKVLS
jgi:hypothetical protein